MSVLSRDGVSLEHDLIVGAASDSNARPLEHEALTEKIRFLRIDDDKAVVTQLPGLVVELPLDDLGDSCFFVEIARHEAEPGLGKV